MKKISMIFPMWILSHDFFPLKPEMDMIKHPIFQHPSPTEFPRQVLTIGRRFGRVGQLGNGEARLNGSSWRKGEWACETNSKLTRIPISKIMIGFLTNKQLNMFTNVSITNLQDTKPFPKS